MDATFGEELRNIRLVRRLRLADVASKLKVSIAWVSAIETGKKAPSVEFVEKFCRAYDIDASKRVSLEGLAEIAREAIEIRFNDNPHGAARDLALAFARRYSTFGEADIAALLEQLKVGPAKK